MMKEAPGIEGARTREGLEIGDELEVAVERILPGGYGLAHGAEHTILVALAAPGDKVKVRIEKIRGSTAFASIVEVLNASAVRVEPKCQYFGLCGGCDFQQMSYEAQLEAKREIIRDCFHRIARIDLLDIPMTGSPLQWSYRSRAEWHCDPATGRVGYFERDSRSLCDVEECPILAPELQSTLSEVRGMLDQQKVRRHVKSINAVLGDSAVVTSLAGDNDQDSRRIGEFEYTLRARTFFQANASLLEQLIESAVGSESGRVAVDLYCGVGLFTLPLGRRFEKVIGIEESRAAVELAIRNVVKAGLDNIDIVAADAASGLASLTPDVPIDLLIVDPPRTGMTNSSVKALLQLRPRRINYVSCDPATMARDVRKFCEAGYTLDSVQGFDMFPQTHHVEALAKLVLD